MRLLVVGVAVLASCLALPANADPWKVTTDASLTMTQAQYSNNWTGGEIGTLSWVFNDNSTAERQFNPKLNDRTTLLLAFGQTHSQDKDTKNWESPLTSTDKINFETVLRFTMGWVVDPYAALRIETEFMDQTDPSHKRVLNPALFIESAGVSRLLMKADKRLWTMRLGAAVRQNVNRDALDPMTEMRKTMTTNDGGVEYVNEFTSPFSGDKLSYTNRLSVYEALWNSKSEELAGLPNENFWRSPHVNFENTFTANVTKYVMVNLYIQILYDKEVSKAGRLQQTLGLGLTYKWSR